MKCIIKIFIIILLYSVLNSNAFGQEFNNENSKIETWYTYWGIGYSSASYPSVLQEAIDFIKEQRNSSSMSISLDLLGIYIPVTQNLLGGAIINGSAERIEISDAWIQINQYLYALSAYYFPLQSIGDGLFIRADAGLAKLVLQDSLGDTFGSDLGFGVLFGGGWSFDLGGTSLLLNVNYTQRNVEDENYGTLNFSVGGLF